MQPDQLLLAEATSRTIFEWGRVQSPVDLLAPLAATAVVLALVVYLYRRDGVELRGPVRWLLTALRMAAFLALLAIYLQPQWRNEVDQVQNSRVVVLADTSISMGLHDVEETPVPAEPSRAQRLAAALGRGNWLDRLRRKHDVVLARFDQESPRLLSLNKRADESTTSSQTADDEKLDFEEALAPRGAETRLGHALKQWIDAERTSPLSGVVVFTDGQHNAGLDPAAAVEQAREARVPIYAVGIGSLTQPVNVRISDLQSPPRAYPGDRYTVTGFLQAQGLAGKSVTVELESRDATEKAAAEGKLEATQEVTLGGDGEVVPVRFELTPTEAGRRTLKLRVRPPAADRNPSDNQQEADVEIVDRKTRVLLFAGGPTREYQFLRNQLRRDRDVVVDVFLQSGAAGISQDAHTILDAFPTTPEALFEYDALVAFDPDWRQLSATQQELVERWVSDQAGGLIVIAGPVYTDHWAQDAALGKIRGLYPVEFHRRLTLLGDSRHEADEPWPIEFTRDGAEAEFLWIEDSLSASVRAWADFPGVYGHYSVRGAKPAATVYAYFADPRAAEAGQKPVYLVGQFFGAGRVFYLGSGEMWRLRAKDDAYFERFYTKLLRHVSQGRLLRGSQRGVLLVERDRYFLGGTVDVRAQLADSRLAPLELPRVPLEITLPDTTHQSIQLLADPTKKGGYRGQFTVRKEGTYLLELPVPDSDERLSRRVQVKMPELEREHPQRNDALLSEIARQTGGLYYVGLEAALGENRGPSASKPLIEVLRDASRTVTTISTPTPLWSNAWTMCALCGLLCLEWLIRRLAKLA
ncbi:MAG TPA: vWA domain-containing protein [Pirellulales bacterium]|nr:vWA domain-containing protein [Pirellulales bacterium]